MRNANGSRHHVCKKFKNVGGWKVRREGGLSPRGSSRPSAVERSEGKKRPAEGPDSVLGEGHYSRFFERRKSRGRVYSYLSVGHRAVQRPLSSSMNRTVQRNSCGPFLFYTLAALSLSEAKI